MKMNRVPPKSYTYFSFSDLMPYTIKNTYVTNNNFKRLRQVNNVLLNNHMKRGNEHS